MSDLPGRTHRSGLVARPLKPVPTCGDCHRPLVSAADFGFSTPGLVHLVLCIPRPAR